MLLYQKIYKCTRACMGCVWGDSCSANQFSLDISNLVVITSSSESRMRGRALGKERETVSLSRWHGMELTRAWEQSYSLHTPPPLYQHSTRFPSCSHAWVMIQDLVATNTHLSTALVGRFSSTCTNEYRGTSLMQQGIEPKS